MKSFGVLLLAALAVLALTAPVTAVPGEQRIVHGIVEWTPGPGGPRFVVLRGDDGLYYSADISKLPTPPPALNRGDRVSITGREGMSPHELLALSVATAGPAPASTPPPPAAAAPAPPAPTVTVPPPAPQPPAVQADRLEGHVRAVSGNQVLLRTTGGREIAVQMPASDLSEVLQPGDELTVFGQQDGERRFIATGFIHVETPTSGSALPRQRRR